MKKIIELLVMFSWVSLGAFELEVDMGAGAHYSGAEGKLVYQKEFWKDTSADMVHENIPSFYIWSEFSTEKKYFPKLRLEFSSYITEGNSFIHIDSIDTINDIISAIEDKFPVSINNTSYESRLSQNIYEGYLYYEYFEDSNVPTLGFGLGVKVFDFAYNATLLNGLEFTDNGGETIPLLFFKSRYEFDKEDDGAQLSFEAASKIYIFGDSTIYDLSFKTDFMMEYNKDTDIGIELGYKYSYINIKGSDINTVGGDMTNTGIFVGIVGHFR